MSDIFISYSRHEAEFVRRLHDAVLGRDREVWVDYDDIPPSADWREQLRQGIETSDTFAFVISTASLRSPECAYELEEAVRLAKRIIPIVREAPGTEKLPAALSSANWVFFREEDDFEGALDSLMVALEVDSEWLREHTRLLARARAWEERGGDRRYLLRGAPLHGSEEWLARAGAGREPTALETEFIAASRRAASRRQRVLLSGVSLALLLAIALATFALIERGIALGQRRDAISTSLANAARAVLVSDPEHAVVLARSAVRERATPAADQSLRQAVAAVQLRAKLVGHRGTVHSVSFSPDMRSLVTAGDDGTARIWDQQGRQLQLLRGHTAAVRTAAFSPDGREVITASQDRTARLWDATTGRSLMRFRDSAPMVYASIDRRGMIITADEQGAAQLWSPQSAHPLATLPSTGQRLSSAVATRDGTRLALSDTGGAVRLWNPVAHAVRRVPTPAASSTGRGGPGQQAANSRGGGGGGPGGGPGGGGPGGPAPGGGGGGPGGGGPGRGGPGGSATAGAGHDIAVSPDGGLIAIAGSGSTTLERPSGRVVATLQATVPLGGPLRNQIVDVAFSPDGKLLATASAEPGVTRIWQIPQRKLSYTLRGNAHLSTVRFSPDSRFLVTVGQDASPQVWNVLTGEQVTALAGHRGVVGDAAFSPDSNLVATASADGTARVWEAHLGRIIGQWHQAGLQTADISRDGRRVITSSEAAVSVWDTTTSRRLAAVTPARPIVATALNPDGHSLAVETTRGVQVIPISPGGPGRPITMVGGGLSGSPAQVAQSALRASVTFRRPPRVAFSPDGRRLLASALDGTLRLWDPSSGRIAATLQGRPGTIAGAWLSPGGRVVVAAGIDHVVRIWSTLTGKSQAAFGFRGTLLAASFSPDERRLLTSGIGSLPTVRDTGHGRVIATLAQGVDSFSAAFSNDGRRLATGGISGIGRIWDATTARSLFTLTGHAGAINDVAFNPGNRLLATASNDQSARIWDTATGDQIVALGGATGDVRSVSFTASGTALLTTSDDDSARLYSCGFCGTTARVVGYSQGLVGGAP